MNDRATNQPTETLEHARASLAKTSFFATAGIFLSRISGLVRTQVVSALFGASTSLSAFVLAYRFPNALRDLFADGALSAAFTKVYVEARAEGIEAERKLVSTITAFFGFVTLVIAMLGAYFSYNIMKACSQEAFEVSGGLAMATSYFRVLAFYLPITMMSAVAMSMLSTLRMTFRATIASAFLNLGTISGAIAGAMIARSHGGNGIFGLVFGTIVGGFLQFSYQAWPLIRSRRFPFPSMRWNDIFNYAPLHEVIQLMAPRALAQGSMILALLINTSFATDISPGALVHIQNAQTLILVPVGLFGVATSLTSLPMLSEAVVARDAEKFSELLTEGLHTTLWLALVTIFGFSLLIFPFGTVFYEHGRFHRADVLQMCLAVNAYSLGILFNSGSKVLQPGFFALGRTKQVVYNAVVYLVLNASLSALLAPRFGVMGLGLSNSAAASSDFLLNLYFLNKLAKRSGIATENIYKNLKMNLLRRIFIFIALGVVFAACGLLLSSQIWAHVMPSHATLKSLAILLGGGVVILPLIVVVTRVAGPESLTALLKRLRRKLPV